jgi:aldehyde dehydrogenase (NAD+)
MPLPELLKKATLELGGKAAHIIFEDAPIDQAVEGIVQWHLFQPGPCMLCRFPTFCTGKILQHSSSKKLKRRMDTLIVGDPLDKNTDIGAINSKETIQYHSTIH